jgi:hypothetical protein
VFDASAADSCVLVATQAQMDARRRSSYGTAAINSGPTREAYTIIDGDGGMMSRSIRLNPNDGHLSRRSSRTTIPE